MAIETLLAQMGYRTKGSGGGGFGELVEGLAEVNKVMQDQQTKEAERKQKKFDQFKMLRDAGYSSQQAYDLILKGEGLPAPEGEGTTSIDKKSFQLDTDTSIPEGYEIKGYDQKGNPMIRQKTVNVAEEKFKVEQEEKGKQEENRAASIKESAYDTLKTISEVEKGIGHFGLTGSVPSLPGTERYNWETNINKLLSGKIINLMTSMKEASKTGATGFGQLSNKELGVLQQASTALKKGLSPEDAQRYLNDMKTALQKIVNNQKQEAIKSGKTSKGISWSVEE